MRFLSFLRRAAPWATLIGLLAGCGGSTSPVQDYLPQRLIVFGDETSALIDDGNHNARKYSVNGINATTNERDCAILPIWVQSVAARFGFVFAECNPGGITNPLALMRAQPGATVEDPTIGLAQQIAEQQANGLGSGDLVTVLIGGNDIVALYNQVQAGQLTQPEAVAEVRRRGSVTAQLVNQVLALNTRVLLVTVPDPGLSPFAIAAEQLVAGSRWLLSTLTREYNSYLRIGVDSTRFDGRNYGLVLGDDIVASAVNNPTVYLAAPTNVVDAVCIVVLPNCTSATADLVADGAPTRYLWADSLHIGSAMHNQIAGQAVSRATTLPF